MQALLEGSQVVSYLKGPNSLLDARLSRYELFSDSTGVSADLHFFMRPSAEFSRIVLRLEQCREVSFSYTDDFFFYNVERVKLLQHSANDFFVSLDPYDESGKISERDGDFVRSTGLTLFKYSHE